MVAIAPRKRSRGETKRTLRILWIPSGGAAGESAGGTWKSRMAAEEGNRETESKRVQPRPSDRQVVIYWLPADSHVVVSVPNWQSIISRWQSPSNGEPVCVKALLTSPPGARMRLRGSTRATNQSCLSTLSRMREKRPIVNVYREDTHTDAAGRG